MNSVKLFRKLYESVISLKRHLNPADFFAVLHPRASTDRNCTESKYSQVLFQYIRSNISAFVILRYKFFGIRVAAIGLLSFFLSTVIFINIIFAKTLSDILFTSSELILVLIFSFWLIRSVLGEVKQRELIEQQSRELTETNRRQENLLRFIGHEVKGSLTKDAAAFAALIEGDLGTIPEEAKLFMKRALTQTRGGARSVMNILKAANLKAGTVSFNMEPIDFKVLVKEAFGSFIQTASEKGLTYTLSINEKLEPYTIVGDSMQLCEHLLRNLIDNAINYTPQGSVSVSLNKNSNGDIIFSIQDTGIGLTDDDKARLFTEGGHGKDSIKVNAHSTGYGLYIAKNIVEAHKGTIYAESEGFARGTRFIVELPPTKSSL